MTVHRKSLIASLLYASTLASMAGADVVELAGGAKLAGSVPDDQERTTLSINLEGGGRVTLDRSHVASVSAESEAAVEYRKRAATAPDTVESQWALAMWCQERRLADEYRRRLERVLQLDPQHDEARRLLGYQQHAGRWLSREQLMTARGMIRHGGDYRTRQEIAILERQEQAEQLSAKWKDQLERWRRNLGSSDPDRAREAAAGFQSLADPAAGPQLAEMLLEERNPAAMRLLIQAAAQVRSQATVSALSTMALEAANEELRFVCLEHLAKAQTPGLAEPFVRALRSKDNEMVNRGAAALEEISATGAVGPLIDALVTEHKFVPAQTAPGEQSYTFRPGGGGFSFGDNRPKPVKQSLRNPKVLSALVKFTGQNYGYDQERWRAWLAAMTTETVVDLRRDP